MAAVSYIIAVQYLDEFQLHLVNFTIHEYLKMFSSISKLTITLTFPTFPTDECLENTENSLFHFNVVERTGTIIVISNHVS